MEESTLPRDVQEFIERYVPSAGSLEILLLLFANRDRAWTVEQIVAKLRSNNMMVKDFLAYFESKDIVVQDDNASFTVNHQYPNLIANLTELSRVYHERPVSVLNEIYRVPGTGSKIQLFADAFKIKKKD